MRPLHTPLCVLEPQLEAHAHEMFEVLVDPAIYQFEGVPPPSIERLANGFRLSESRTSPDGTEKWLNWVVRLPSGQLTGYVQATILPTGASYIGYEFSSKFWRQGLGSASVSAVAAELASHYQVHTVVAVLKTVNFRSMGLLQKLGFKPCAAEEAAKFTSEPDETILVKYMGQQPSNRGANAA